VYDELYDAWRKEKATAEIQKLAKDFHEKLANYMKTIKKERRMLDEKTTRARLLKAEFENATRLAKELIELRYEKALRNAASGEPMPREVLTEEEERLHNGILPLAEAYKKFLNDVLRGRLSQVAKKERPTKILVRFLRDVPAIVGADMKTYGPFKPEDIATLPRENARVLMKRDVAIEVEAK
jgi:DNA replication factor GINS